MRNEGRNRHTDAFLLLGARDGYGIHTPQRQSLDYLQDLDRQNRNLSFWVAWHCALQEERPEMSCMKMLVSAVVRLV